MAYFLCSGGSGKGNTLIVTCDSMFAGVDVSITDGTKVKTKTCPSSSPYTVTFFGIEAGTWTISATVNGETYTNTITVEDNTGYLYEFYWPAWAAAGGLDPDDYDDLDDLFDDEPAVRRLMTVHASADYLVGAVTNNLKILDLICANDLAMKWLGQSDYICDQLEKVTGAVTKLLASDYWERYLKDHVPTMTANSAPYGTASDYKVFDGTSSTTTGTVFSYVFRNPICIKKFISSAQGEATLSYSMSSSGPYIDIPNPAENTNYAHYYKLTFLTSKEVMSLQFYGRSTSLWVPKMTGNTSPYGTAIGTHYSDYYEYLAFNRLNGSYKDCWASSGNGWVGYEFMHRRVSPKVIFLQNRNHTTVQAFSTFKIQGYNEATDEWEDISDTLNTTSSASAAISFFNTITSTNKKGYRKIRLLVGSNEMSSIGQLQFYCNDYSEKEFESNVNKIWLFDHGLELETLDTTGSVTIADEKITLSAANAQASKTIDLTNYKMIYVKVGNRMSGTTTIIAGSTGSASLNDGDAPFMNVLSVANINQSLAAGVKMTSSGTCDITELWLE